MPRLRAGNQQGGVQIFCKINKSSFIDYRNDYKLAALPLASRGFTPRVNPKKIMYVPKKMMRVMGIITSSITYPAEKMRIGRQFS